jgi:hypothetical protein
MGGRLLSIALSFLLILTQETISIIIIKQVHALHTATTQIPGSPFRHEAFQALADTKFGSLGQLDEFAKTEF